MSLAAEGGQIGGDLHQFTDVIICNIYMVLLTADLWCMESVDNIVFFPYSLKRHSPLFLLENGVLWGYGAREMHYNIYMTDFINNHYPYLGYSFH